MDGQACTIHPGPGGRVKGNISPPLSQACGKGVDVFPPACKRFLSRWETCWRDPNYMSYVRQHEWY